jgi:hypothetical protein
MGYDALELASSASNWALTGRKWGHARGEA